MWYPRFRLTRLIILPLLIACGLARAGTFVVDWTYQYGVNNPGTQIERVFGKLIYKGDELPKQLHHVVTPIGEYLYVADPVPQLRQTVGWVPYGKLSTLPDGSLHAASKQIEVEELMTGNDGGFRRVIVKGVEAGGSPVLQGSFDYPPQGVGKNWFYAVDNGVWIDPAKLGDALKALPGFKAPAAQ
jgi:hypothetical protein